MQLSPSHLFLMGLLATSALILFQTQRRLQRSIAPRIAHKARKQPSQESLSAEQSEWEVRMHEYSRDVSARLDSKMASLEYLLRAAHEERVRLETAVAQARTLGVLPPESEPGTLPVEDPYDSARLFSRTYSSGVGNSSTRARSG